MDNNSTFSSDGWRFAFSHFTDAANSISKELNDRTVDISNKVVSLDSKLSNLATLSLTNSSSAIVDLNNGLAAVSNRLSVAEGDIAQVDAQAQTLFLNQANDSGTINFLTGETKRLTTDNLNQDTFAVSIRNDLNNLTSDTAVYAARANNALTKIDSLTVKVNTISTKVDSLATAIAANTRVRPSTGRWRIPGGAGPKAAYYSGPINLGLGEKVVDSGLVPKINESQTRYTATGNVRVRLSLSTNFDGNVANLLFNECYVQASYEGRNPAFMHGRTLTPYLTATEGFNLQANEWVQIVISWSMINNIQASYGDTIVTITEEQFW